MQKTEALTERLLAQPKKLPLSKVPNTGSAAGALVLKNRILQVKERGLVFDPEEHRIFDPEEHRIFDPEEHRVYDPKDQESFIYCQT